MENVIMNDIKSLKGLYRKLFDDIDPMIKEIEKEKNLDGVGTLFANLKDSIDRHEFTKELSRVLERYKLNLLNVKQDDNERNRAQPPYSYWYDILPINKFEWTPGKEMARLEKLFLIEVKRIGGERVIVLKEKEDRFFVGLLNILKKAKGY